MAGTTGNRGLPVCGKTLATVMGRERNDPK